MTRGFEDRPRKVIRDDVVHAVLSGSDVLYGNAENAHVIGGNPVIYGHVGHLMIRNDAAPVIYGDVGLLQHGPNARWSRANEGLTGHVEEIAS